MRPLEQDNPTDEQLAQRVLAMYARGWFPMADPRTGRLDWVQPQERAVIPLEEHLFHVPRTLRQRVRQARFEVRCDTAFEAVIVACAEPAPGREHTWIDDRIIRMFMALHRQRHAHSIEAWRGGRLVGGLYGVQMGSAFCGESMFSRRGEGTDASKVCLVHLVHHLRSRGFAMLDSQLHNEHLEQFGLVETPRADYLRRLRACLASPREWGRFDGERAPAEA